MTSRRGLVMGLGVALTVSAVMARPATPRSPRLIKIGALTESWGPTPAIVGLRDGLEELGYRENRDFVLGVRFTQGDVAQLPAAARALVRHEVDVIVTTEQSATKAAQGATTTIPIVFMGGSDPVEAGLVKSFARPGGNITGVSDLGLELVPKRVQIFRELVPGLERVLLVYDATSAASIARVSAHREAARRLGLTLVERPVRTEEEARAVIGRITKGEVDGIVVPRLLSLNIPGLVLEVARTIAMPTMFTDVFWVERGALASYSATLTGLGHQAARLVDKILKGANPREIPVERPTKFELAINLGTAKALGIAIPPALQIRADRIIE